MVEACLQPDGVAPDDAFSEHCIQQAVRASSRTGEVFRKCLLSARRHGCCTKLAFTLRGSPALGGKLKSALMRSLAAPVATSVCRLQRAVGIGKYIGLVMV